MTVFGSGALASRVMCHDSVSEHSFSSGVISLSVFKSIIVHNTLPIVIVLVGSV